MVARTPQPTEATSDVRRVNGIPVQKKGAQEEPGQSKRASTAQKSAQDVAGLKDFVGHGMIQHWRDRGLQGYRGAAIRGLSGKGSLWISV